MVLTDILPSERVCVARKGRIDTKEDALRRLAELLAAARDEEKGVEELRSSDFFHILHEREALQSTGIGDGVAIPHGSIDGLKTQRAALLVCPDGLPFDAIDDLPVRILFAVVGPRRTTGEHLKTLARVSRLLRDVAFREKLLSARKGAEAWMLVREAEDGRAA